MTQKTIVAALIAVSFVAGSIMTGGLAFAAQGEPKGTPFKAIWIAIEDLQDQINQIENLRTGLSCENNLLLKNEIPEFTPDLGECDLSGVNLSSEVWNNVDFAGAILTNADMSGSDFINADFTNADLTGANLQNSSVEEAIFTQAILESADFDGAIDQPTGSIDCIGTPLNAEFTCTG